MKKETLYKFFLVACAFFIAFTALIPLPTVEAASDQKWINQVWNKYKTYNKKTVSDYKTYQQQIDKNYKQLYDTSQAALDVLESKVLADQEQWNEKLKDDLDEMERLFGDNRDMANKLRDYKNFISPTYLNSPMWKYTKEASRTYLNSKMWKLDKELSETYLNSYMWKYNKTISPTYLNSAAWKMKNNVSETYLNSYMWKLRNASSDTYLNSPMWKYRSGKISKTQAQKQYDALYKQQTTALANNNAARKKEIANMANSTKTNVNQLILETSQALESQREETLQRISEARKKLTGEGLTWEPLLLVSP